MPSLDPQTSTHDKCIIDARRQALAKELNIRLPQETGVDFDSKGNKIRIFNHEKLSRALEKDSISYRVIFGPPFETSVSRSADQDNNQTLTRPVLPPENIQLSVIGVPQHCEVASESGKGPGQGAKSDPPPTNYFTFAASSLKADRIPSPVQPSNQAKLLANTKTGEGPLTPDRAAKPTANFKFTPLSQSPRNPFVLQTTEASPQSTDKLSVHTAPPPALNINESTPAAQSTLQPVSNLFATQPTTLTEPPSGPSVVSDKLVTPSTASNALVIQSENGLSKAKFDFPLQWAPKSKRKASDQEPFLAVHTSSSATSAASSAPQSRASSIYERNPSPASSIESVKDTPPVVDPVAAMASHMDLLSGGDEQDDYQGRLSELFTTPLFSEQVRQFATRHVKGSDDPFSQYGLIAGDVKGIAHGKRNEKPGDVAGDPRLFYNIAAPSSVFICGSQGSGKSHSLSCLLENCLVPSQANCLPRPLTGIVFHYDTFVSDNSGTPCEAAYLSSHKDVSVRVLCAPTNIGHMRRIYSKLPNVIVEELRINESDLNTSRMLELMAVKSATSMPLYLSVVNRILRELRVEQQQTGSTFNYSKFKQRIDEETLTEHQLAPLKQRLDTLESFMNHGQATAYTLSNQMLSQAGRGGGGRGGSAPPGPARKAAMTAGANSGNNWKPKVGQLTVVDLSCPCVTAEMACSLFGICLSLFLEQDSNIGRVVALDEAHKYMTESAECHALTESLLATIRLQRHLGARVIISTQEPTISPRLLDLCSVTIVHRFTSPDWLTTLRKHLAGASVPSEVEDDSLLTRPGKAGINPLHLDPKNMSADLFSRIVALRTGEALLFAPSAVIGVKHEYKADGGWPWSTSEEYVETGEDTLRLGNGVLKVRVRKRVTADGGRSIMAH